jgi:hypothetical protein
MSEEEYEVYKKTHPYEDIVEEEESKIQRKKSKNQQHQPYRPFGPSGQV